MPLYEYECSKENCKENDKPFEFEEMKKLSERDQMVDCPKCGDNKEVKKVQRTAFPKSHTWGV